MDLVMLLFTVWVGRVIIFLSRTLSIFYTIYYHLRIYESTGRIQNDIT